MRSCVHAFIVALILGSGPGSDAAIGWRVPDDPVMGTGPDAIPKYFSGCNARAFISAYSLPQSGGDPAPVQPTIIKSQLFLNGQFIEEKIAPSGPTGQVPAFSMGHSVMFDAAHFGGPGAGTITVEQRVWEVGDTSPQVNSYTAPSASESILAGYHSVDYHGYFWYSSIDLMFNTTWHWTAQSNEMKITGALAPKLNQMSYETDVLNSLQWSAGTFLAGWAGKNIVFAALHGLPQTNNRPARIFGGSEDPWDSYPGFPQAWPPPSNTHPVEMINGVLPVAPNIPAVFIGPYESYWRIRYFRVAQIGTGLPPFNTLAQPPINLAFYYSCDLADGGGNSDPGISGDSLYPNGNVYTGVSSFPENQATVMFSVPVPVAAASTLRDHCFYFLQIGYSVRYAMDKWADFMGISDWDVSPVHVYGDRATRISRVYISTVGNQSTAFHRNN